MGLEEQYHRASPWLAVIATAVVTLPLLGQSTTAAPDAKCKTGSTTAGCPAKTAAQPQGSTSKSAASVFAFPMEDSEHGANPDGTPSSAATKPDGAGSSKSGDSLPAMPTGAVPDPPASSERPMGGAGSSDSGSDLPPGTSSSNDGADPDEGIAPTTAAPNAPVKAARLKDLGSHSDSSAARAKLEQTRVADDIKVGLFYTKDGNSQGAYLRFKDALERAPDDPEVRFYLAESAGHLNKRDEAVENYRQYLQLDPGGDHDKASRKALAKLGSPLP